MKASSTPHTTSVVPNTRRYICGLGFQPVHDTRGNTRANLMNSLR